MKKVTLTVMSMCYLFCFAQPNNPYHKTGLEFIKSAKIILDDMNQGLIKDVTQETISYFQKKIPMAANIDAGAAAEVIKTGQTKQFDPRVSIKNSTFSTGAKEILKNMVENQLTMDELSFSKHLQGFTDMVLKAAIPPQEREALLQLIAIEYHLATQPIIEERRGACEVQVADTWIKLNRRECKRYLALMGFIQGHSYCGNLCGLGGALVGYIVGSTS